MNQVPINLEKLQAVLLQTLNVFDKLCKEHSIPYMLAYGNLLGSIRHKGFIPWDDDVDVVLLRSDYEKLERVFAKGNLPSGYGYDSLNNGQYVYPYMKFYYLNSELYEDKLTPPYDKTPIWIDIFPLDNMPKAKIAQRFLLWHSTLLRKFLYTSIVDKDKVHGLEKSALILLKPFARQIGAHRIARWIDSVARKRGSDSTSLVANVVWTEGMGEVMPKEVFTSYQDSPFEDGQFPIPQEYEKVLQGLYGEYMVLPPKEVRTSHLDFTRCFILEENK